MRFSISPFSFSKDGGGPVRTSFPSMNKASQMPQSRKVSRIAVSTSSKTTRSTHAPAGRSAQGNAARSHQVRYCVTGTPHEPTQSGPTMPGSLSQHSDAAASLRHVSKIALCQHFVFNPVDRQLEKDLQVTKILLSPAPAVVCFIVAKPGGSFGASLHLG